MYQCHANLLRKLKIIIKHQLQSGVGASNKYKHAIILHEEAEAIIPMHALLDEAEDYDHFEFGFGIDEPNAAEPAAPDVGPELQVLDDSFELLVMAHSAEAAPSCEDGVYYKEEIFPEYIRKVPRYHKILGALFTRSSDSRRQSADK